MNNTFDARATINVGETRYEIFSVARLASRYAVDRLPYAQKILLENLLRHEDGVNVTIDDIEALANWDAKAKPSQEIAFTPARVLMQDFTGVPAVVDLAAMRDAMQALGGDPARINPLSPAELVIDHSVQVDVFGSANAASENARIEFGRQQRALQFPALGPKRVLEFLRRAAGYRDRAPGQPRISRAPPCSRLLRTEKCRLTPIPWSALTPTRP